MQLESWSTRISKKALPIFSAIYGLYGLYGGVFSLVFAGCSSPDGAHGAHAAPAAAQPEQAWPQGTPASARITITNDAATLAARLHVAPHEIGLATQSMNVVAGGAPGAGIRPPSLRWIGQLDPPQIVPERAHYSADDVDADPAAAPVPLLAATVSIAANVALVSYTLMNEYFGGAVDVLDITDPSMPVLRASALFQHMDIVSAELVPSDGTSGSGQIYVAAATCDPKYPGTALVERLALSHFALDDSADYRMPLLGGSGEGVAIADGRLYGTAGVKGGVRMFDAASGSLLGEAPIGGLGDARWVSVAGGLAAVVSGGDSGRLDLFNAATLAPIATFPFDGADVPEAKSTVQLVGPRAFVAAGRGGMQVLSTRTGALLGSLPLPKDTGYAAADVATNAVSVDRDLVFVANGGPGVTVAGSADPIDQATSETPFRIAWLSALDIAGSVNHVAFRGHTLLVASGTNGLQVVAVE
jgi:hypothetical protein